LSALLWVVTCCATAPSLAQQRDEGSDFSVLSNDTNGSAAPVTPPSILRETEVKDTDCASTEEPRLSWKPEWPRYKLLEYLSIPVLGITTFTLQTQVDNPHHARLQGGFLIDRPMQDLLRLSNRDDRATADAISDVSYWGLQLYSAVVDVLVVSLAIHGLPDVALELAVMTAQAFAISHTVVTFTKKVVGRERPYSERCESEGDQIESQCEGTERYTSFLSGHTLGAFTGAGLICAQHQKLDLYGGGAVEEFACGSALALASVTGFLRIVSDRHWFSDVLASAAIGLASGWLMSWLLHFQFNASQSYNSAFNNGMIVPLLDDKVYGIGYFTVF